MDMAKGAKSGATSNPTADLSAISTLAQLYAASDYASKNLTVFLAAMTIAFGEKELTASLSAGTRFIPTDEVSYISSTMLSEDLPCTSGRCWHVHLLPCRVHRLPSIFRVVGTMYLCCTTVLAELSCR